MLVNHNPRKGSLMDTTIEKAVAGYLASLKQEGRSDGTCLLGYGWILALRKAEAGYGAAKTKHTSRSARNWAITFNQTQYHNRPDYFPSRAIPLLRWLACGNDAAGLVDLFLIPRDQGYFQLLSQSDVDRICPA
jgi:hypothetical protein